tara:strand:- start:75 stop:1925 length:1851 start_codon:yes stop_codon:yes gene_type:complete
MSLQKLLYKPGLNRDLTNYMNEGGWYECDKIRFLSGSPQKMGGWAKYIPSPLLGVCRQMFNYVTSFDDNIMFLGTSSRVYAEAGTVLYDITPLRVIFAPATTNNCLTTGAIGSNVITCVLPAHGAVTGDGVTFSGVTTFGGIPASELNTTQTITYINANTFSFTVTSTATSASTTGGGTAIYAGFQINIGNEITVYGYGWGAGSWGRSGWGEGASAPVVFIQRDWWFDNFDNDVVMNIRGGAIYYWTYSQVSGDPVYTPPVELQFMAGASDCPIQATQMLVSQNQKILLAFGANDYGFTTFNPLLIRWSDIDNPLNWTPTIENSAGFLQLPSGSRIVCASRVRQEILVWTTSILYSLQFTGTNDIFAYQQLADNISIISPRAKATANNTTYWMGLDKFYMYNGTITTLPTQLRNHVFNNLNFEQADQIISGTNEGWNEIWWFYPSANSNQNDSYVIWNHVELVWYYGTIDRSAWIDSPLRQYPQSVRTDGYYYNQEQGCDDDTLPMASYIISSDTDLQDGEHLMLIKRIIPDVDFSGSTAENPEVLITMRPRNFPGGAYQSEPSEPVIQTAVNQYTDQVFLRARARQMGFKIESVNLGVKWQLGAPRIDGRPDGIR